MSSQVSNTMEKSKYKQLARRLKEERNMYREAAAGKAEEQAVLQEEVARMEALVAELRLQCHHLQQEVQEKEVQEAEVQVS